MTNQDQQDSLQLSKKERKFLRRQQKEKERLSYQRQKKLLKFLWVAIGILIIGGGILGFGWFLVTRPATPESEIIAKTGLHWHADLSIKILGQYQDIPAGIGLAGLPHKPIHTHDRDSVIHMEFAGMVKKDDIKLGQFFKVWGETFTKDCIFDKCTGPENQLTMLINGKENSEFENYVMKDGDKIEIIYE